MMNSRAVPNIATSVETPVTLTGNEVAFPVITPLPSDSPLVKQFSLSRELKLGVIATSICGCNLNSK